MKKKVNLKDFHEYTEWLENVLINKKDTLTNLCEVSFCKLESV